MWDFPLFPESASNIAGEVDGVFIALLIVSAAFAILIAGLLVWFAVRYREGSRANRAEPKFSRVKLETVMITVPFVISMVVYVAAADLYFRVETPPADALDVWVVGKQWMWKVQHPDGQREINTLHVPIGEPVRLRMISQDVIHSFYIPAFRVKQDVLPGRYTTLWFEATKLGDFQLHCAEFCGMDHASMKGRVIVMKPADYERWLSGASEVDPTAGTPGTPSAPMALRGAGPFFKLGCNACHVPESSLRAPRLDGLFGRPIRLINGAIMTADADYIRESILDPNAKITAGYPQPSLMPSYRGQVTEEQIIELIEYIRSLSPTTKASQSESDSAS